MDVYWCWNKKRISMLDIFLPAPSLSSVDRRSDSDRRVPFEYEIRIRWRTTHTSVYVCLNWPLYGNGPGAERWKRIDSIRCVSRIEVTPVGHFASGCFRSKGFNIKPRLRLTSLVPDYIWAGWNHERVSTMYL